MKKLTTEYLMQYEKLTTRPKHYGVYSMVGELLDKFSTQQLFNFIIKETDWNIRGELEKGITEYVLAQERYKKELQNEQKNNC